jgi:2-hydroxychromene-2-carboxylate isomerase
MPTLDVFVFPGSTYSYLTVLRIGPEAERRGFEVRWRPFDVRSIMIEMDNIPFARKPIKARYMWRDIERRAARHGIPFAGQPPYPVDPQLQALRVASVAAAEGWCGAFLEASYRAWFMDGLAPGLGDNTPEVLSRLGRDAEAVLAAADTPEIAERLAAETNTARTLGIFGSPTFAVGDEIFWGDDRLDDAVDWLLART